jgi:hypothetical protein
VVHLCLFVDQVAVAPACGTRVPGFGVGEVDDDSLGSGPQKRPGREVGAPADRDDIVILYFLSCFLLRVLLAIHSLSLTESRIESEEETGDGTGRVGFRLRDHE